MSSYSEPINASNTKQNIIIATHVEPPLVYIEKGVFHGSNVDIARLLARRMNKTVEFIYCPFVRCLSITKRGHADMMLSLNKTEERQAYFSYFERPFRTNLAPVRFYVKKESHLTIERYEDLKNLTVGVLRGGTYFNRFDHDKTLNKVESTSHAKLIDMLLKDRIDIFLGKTTSVKSQVDEYIYENEMRITPYIYAQKEGSYIIISKLSPLNNEFKAFSDTLNLLLDNGEIAEILEKDKLF